MDEQKNKEMDMTGEQEELGTGAEEKNTASEENVVSEENSVSSENETQAPAGLPTRSLMLLVLAGIYLLYTGYRLCKNVIDGVEGGSMGFMLAGVAFLLIGVGMLFVGVRGVYKADRLKKAQEAEATAAANAQKAQETETAKKAEKEKMSISERASLAKHLEDEETAQEDTMDDDQA